MTVAELIAALQQHDQNAIVVVSTFESEDRGDRDAVTVERRDISAIRLRPVDENEYRTQFTVVFEDGIPGVWLG